jgi:hypothetical protein
MEKQSHLDASPPSALKANLQASLARDLAAFADPGVGVQLEKAADGWVNASWEIKGTPHRASFLLTGEADLQHVSVRLDGSSSVMSYASFLASSTMSDLMGVAKRTLGALPSLSSYVTPRAQIDDVPIEDPNAVPVAEAADELLREMAAPAEDTTQLVFVTAAAGVGKTTLLKQLVRQQAEKYISGNISALWLYVDAQGRRLARLDDAIAADLDKVRASFPYHATSALVRTGAMVLVVDGFDELLSTAGSYDEAFSSLASFIEDLRGSGAIVAAARSAYYEQEFTTRVNATTGFRTETWALSAVRLLEWNKTEQEDFVRLSAQVAGLGSAEANSLAYRVAEVFKAPEVAHLSGRPFFLTRTVETLLQQPNLANGATLLEKLVNSYIEREVNEKLRTEGRSYLSTAQLSEIFAEVAEEMWRQETRELSRTSVRELLAVLTEVEGLDKEAQRAITERGPYAALLRSGQAPGSVMFEHDVYYSYFLAGPLVDVARQHDELRLRQALRRGRLPVEAGLLAGGRLSKELDEVLPVLLRVCERLDLHTEQVRQNVGSVIVGLLAGGEHDGLQLRLVTFADCPLSRIHLTNVHLENCSFAGADLRGFVVRESTAEGLLFEKVVLDPNSTVLDLTGVGIQDFIGITVLESHGKSRQYYSPTEVRRVLEQCALPAAQRLPALRRVSQDVVEALNTLCWAYLHTNIVSEEDDASAVQRLVRLSIWPELRNALLDSGVLIRETRSASGRKTFLRIRAWIGDILSGLNADAQVPDNVAHLWHLLEERFPADS